MKTRSATRPADLAVRVERAARLARRHATDRPDDDAAALIADNLERLAQLLAWTDAKTAAEHRDRMEVWDDQLRGQWFSRGYTAARDDAVMTRLHGPGAPPLPIDSRPFGLSGFFPPDID